MRRIAAIASTVALAAAGLIGASTPAQAATTDCTLELSKYIYNGANIVMWSQGLSGCAGEVYSEVQAQCNGEWVTWSSYTGYYDNQIETWYGDVEYPAYMRVYARFGSQEKYTAPAWNNSGADPCGGPIG
ncbi:MAG: hypothetical protein HOV79_06565 [Hamadaea sp.]|nr:hypothetical protein [Hamadaea sp.]